MTEFESAKMDALLFISAKTIVDDDLKLWYSINDNDIVINKKHDRKIRKMFMYETKTIPDSIRMRNSKRVIAACLIIMSIMMILAMSITAVRKEFINAVSEWFEKYVVIYFIAETEDGLSAEIIKKEPAIIPEDCDKNVVIDTPFTYAIDYYKNGELILTYLQKPLEKETSFDNEKHSISEIQVNSYSAILFENDDNTILYFHDDKYSYTMTGIINSEEIIKIAESIK